MQTFLCEPTFRATAHCLDYRRLGKQRVEAYQILRAINDANYGWKNHPAVRMWRGHQIALSYYMNTMIKEWVARGYKNNMKLIEKLPSRWYYPPWYDENLIRSHRSNLLRKAPEYYRKFRWNTPDDLPYVWPV